LWGAAAARLRVLVCRRATNTWEEAGGAFDRLRRILSCTVCACARNRSVFDQWYWRALHERDASQREASYQVASCRAEATRPRSAGVSAQ